MQAILVSFMYKMELADKKWKEPRAAGRQFAGMQARRHAGT
jgi:hypothetical protein